MINFVDSNCLLGRRNFFQKKYNWSREDLIKNLEKYSIEKALVYHAMMREHNPSEGNQVLLDDIKDQSNLLPVWSALPNGEITGVKEMPAPADFMIKMKQNNVKVVRLFPDKSLHNFTLAEWSIGNLLHELEKWRLPLMLDYGTSFYGSEQINWERVYKLCTNHPQLPVILIGPDYRSGRKLFPLLRQCSNLYVEISRFMMHRGLEFVCQEFGVEKLIFGSKYPFQNPGAIINLVLYALISKQEKVQIAGKNIEELLDRVRW